MNSNRSAQTGFVLPLCSLLLIVLFIMASFVIDIGNARYQLRKIQIAADASSLAALVALQLAPNSTSVRNEVYDIASRNGVSQAETTAILCGTWSSGVFTSQGVDGSGNPICNTSSNAVQVTMARQVTTFFGKVLNTAYITPRTTAIAARSFVHQCIRPFGVTQAHIEALPSGVTEFIIDRASPGNWGKLEHTGQFSMASDSCSADFRILGTPDTVTGFARVSNAFEEIYGTSDAQNMLIALTSEFPNGGSSPVQVLEFARVNFLESGGSGNNWWARFEIVERNVLPNQDLAVSERKLVG